MRAAPVLSGASFDSEWLVPSGKIRMFPPPAMCAAIFSKTAALADASLSGVSFLRMIGTAPARSSSHDSPGTFHSVDFATGEISHGASVITSTGSRRAFEWFATNTRPRVPTAGASPNRSMSRKYSRIKRRNVPTSAPRKVGGSRTSSANGTVTPS